MELVVTFFFFFPLLCKIIEKFVMTNDRVCLYPESTSDGVGTFAGFWGQNEFHYVASASRIRNLSRKRKLQVAAVSFS